MFLFLVWTLATTRPIFISRRGPHVLKSNHDHLPEAITLDTQTYTYRTERLQGRAQKSGTMVTHLLTIVLK
jgi:hypothetical protein